MGMEDRAEDGRGMLSCGGRNECRGKLSGETEIGELWREERL